MIAGTQLTYVFKTHCLGAIWVRIKSQPLYSSLHNTIINIQYTAVISVSPPTVQTHGALQRITSIPWAVRLSWLKNAYSFPLFSERF